MKSKIEFHPVFSLFLAVRTVEKQKEYEKQRGFAKDCETRKWIRKENKIKYYFKFVLTATKKRRSIDYKREVGAIVPDAPGMGLAGGDSG